MTDRNAWFFGTLFLALTTPGFGQNLLTNPDFDDALGLGLWSTSVTGSWVLAADSRGLRAVERRGGDLGHSRGGSQYLAIFDEQCIPVDPGATPTLFVGATLPDDGRGLGASSTSSSSRTAPARTHLGWSSTVVEGPRRPGNRCSAGSRFRRTPWLPRVWIDFNPQSAGYPAVRRRARPRSTSAPARSSSATPSRRKGAAPAGGAPPPASRPESPGVSGRRPAAAGAGPGARDAARLDIAEHPGSADRHRAPCPKKEGPMKRIAFVVAVVSLVLSLPAAVRAQEHYTEGSVWEVWCARTTHEHFEDYIEYLRVNYLPTMTGAEAAGVDRRQQVLPARSRFGRRARHLHRDPAQELRRRARLQRGLRGQDQGDRGQALQDPATRTSRRT